MGLKFDGLVTSVGDPETRKINRNDGSTVDVTRMRVVNESGQLVDKKLDDGRTVKEREFKDYYDVEAWGGPAKALAMVNKGETVHVGGEIRTTQPRKLQDGTTFYPKDTLRVSSLDFIGQNRAAGNGRVASAQTAVDSEVANNTIDSPMKPVAELEPF